jgi:hypothetical protein
MTRAHILHTSYITAMREPNSIVRTLTSFNARVVTPPKRSQIPCRAGLWDG